MLKNKIDGRVLNACLGGWLFASALLLSRSNGELANNLLLGFSVFLVAFMAMAVHRFSRLNTLLGCWAIASPFALGYRDRLAGINDIAVGVLVIAVSIWVRRGGAPSRHAVA